MYQASIYNDYYPFGMPMPNRHNIDANGYRYAYQGQEKDPETGKEAFELRLWDSRIGRWLTTDPKHAGVSPYWGMNNNPISVIDPDGGKGLDWYEAENGDIIWVDGSDKIDGFKNLGYNFSRETGVYKLLGNGTTKTLTLNGEFQRSFADENTLAPKYTLFDKFLDKTVSPPMEAVSWVGLSLVNGFYGAGKGITEVAKGNDPEELNIKPLVPVSIPQFENGNFKFKIFENQLSKQEMRQEIMDPMFKTSTLFMPATKVAKNPVTTWLFGKQLRNLYIKKLYDDMNQKYHY